MNFLLTKLYWNTNYTHSRADMPVFVPSRLSYAQQCAPSPIGPQAQHLNSVENPVRFPNV
jgi:hypothetical protein